jgi:hypothetical protein
VAWTNPKTWSFGEVLTSTDMNTYVRDNTSDLRLLKETTTRTGAYTLALSDEFAVVSMNAGTAVNVTVPANSSVAFPIGTIVNVYNQSAQTVTVVAAGGVTVRNAGQVLQFQEVSLRKRGTDEWVMV